MPRKRKGSRSHLDEINLIRFFLDLVLTAPDDPTARTSLQPAMDAIALTKSKQMEQVKLSELRFYRVEAIGILRDLYENGNGQPGRTNKGPNNVPRDRIETFLKDVFGIPSDNPAKLNRAIDLLCRSNDDLAAAAGQPEKAHEMGRLSLVEVAAVNITAVFKIFRDHPQAEIQMDAKNYRRLNPKGKATWFWPLHRELERPTDKSHLTRFFLKEVMGYADQEIDGAMREYLKDDWQKELY